MSKRDESLRPDARVGAGENALFRVRPTNHAYRESAIGGGLFRSERERQWVTTQLQLLFYWPLDRRQQQQIGSDLDFSKVTHHNEVFYELRLDDARLHQKNLRVFFWVDETSRTIWIIHAYWKKTNRLADAVKAVVARRIKHLKGAIQDGSIQ